MNRYITIIAFLAGLTATCFAQQYGWTTLTYPSSTDILKRIYVSGNEAWLLANDKLLYSGNYPSVQFSQIFSSSFTFSDMTFIEQNSKKYGWLVGSDSYGARTIDDSALVWQDVYVGGEALGCVSFPDTAVGYSTDTGRSLFKTTDGGATWTEINNSFSVSSINGLVFIDSLIGYFVGSSPAFKKTTDGGLTWTNVGSVTGSMVDVFFYDKTHGWAVGVRDIFYLDGTSWIRVANNSGSTLYSVFFARFTEGWAVGMSGTIIHSTDGGATWSKQESGTSVTLRDVFFTSPTNGYVVGNDGTILHYTSLTTGVSEVIKDEDIIALPNPTNGIVRFNLQGNEQINRIELFDMQGKQVLYSDKVTNDFIDLSALDNGIYFLKLETPDKIYKQKIIKK